MKHDCGKLKNIKKLTLRQCNGVWFGTEMEKGSMVTSMYLLW